MLLNQLGRHADHMLTLPVLHHVHRLQRRNYIRLRDRRQVTKTSILILLYHGHLYVLFVEDKLTKAKDLVLLSVFLKLNFVLAYSTFQV